MTEYHWPTVRDELITLFDGERPHPETEDAIITAFADRPAHIIRTADQLAAGERPRSYWAVLRSRVTQLRPAAGITATDESDRERKILNARRWIHNAGLYFDLERDVLDELFPEHGSGFDSTGGLRPFDTPSLRAEMIEAWKQERPRGQRAEKAAADYMTKLRADTKRVEEMKRQALEAAMEGQEA